MAPTYYEYWGCDICGSEYTTLGGAQECEDFGAPVVPPIGTIIKDGAYIHGMLLLSVVARVPHGVMGAWHTKEVATWNWWDATGQSGAVERSPVGDATPKGKDTCAGGPKCRPYPNLRAGGSGVPFTVLVDRRTRRYHRCWRDMTELGLPLYYWRDGKPVLAQPPIFDATVMTETEALSLVPKETP